MAQNQSAPNIKNRFDLSGRVAIITGGAGLLGMQHAQAIASTGGFLVLVDLAPARPAERAAALATTWKVQAMGVVADITNAKQVRSLSKAVMKRFGRVDILINNAANNPKVEDAGKIRRLRRECPSKQCGAGVFMAAHHDRNYCGKCCVTYMFKKREEEEE